MNVAEPGAWLTFTTLRSFQQCMQHVVERDLVHQLSCNKIKFGLCTCSLHIINREVKTPCRDIASTTITYFTSDGFSAKTILILVILQQAASWCMYVCDLASKRQQHSHVHFYNVWKLQRDTPLMPVIVVGVFLARISWCVCVCVCVCVHMCFTCWMNRNRDILPYKYHIFTWGL